MKKIASASVLLAAAMALTTLASCNSASSDNSLRVYNWGDYIDESVNDIFAKENTCDVKYSTFIQNEDMYTTVNASKGNYDIIVPSDYMISKMIDEGLLAELDMKNIPNFSLLDDKFKNIDFDPGNKYSVPYLWGTVGIVYNTKMVDDTVDSWEILWNEKYSKKIFMMDSVRDSIGIALKVLGYSLNSKNDDELAQAEALLQKQKPLVLAYTEDDIKDKMISGEGAICVMYSGDAITVMDENPDLAYVVPKEGSCLWFDNICIPVDSPNKELAEKYINFMCSDQISQLNRDAINYSSPNIAVRANLPDELKENPAQNPSDEILENCEVFTDLGSYTKKYNEIWSRIKTN